MENPPPALQDTRHYRVINHVCRLCGGRLLKSIPQSSDEPVRVRCADCGAAADGDAAASRHLHEKLCACGAKFPQGTKYALKCGINPEKSIEMPEECVVIPLTSSPP